MTDELSSNEASDRGERMPRRVFFKAGAGLVAAGYAGGIGYPIYRYLATPAQRAAELGAITEMTIPADKMPAVGTALQFLFGNRPTILIHLEDESLVCLDAVCTHLGCTVQFQPDKKIIHCACHGGTYDMHTGKNIAGPPPKPLKQYQVETTPDGQVRISRA
ncbi:MAG: Rieske (2Fe-2S) protein [FCB group bacterium]|jgi:cytochrome b6-f complex iron-sulfur subunit|nr:Rieske (2Fe-2S) protein [FCB group bacterium]